MAKRTIFDRRLLKFLLVGVANTLLSALVMFLLYNLCGFGYWGSSAVSYLLGGLLSYVLNKRFTFENHDGVLRTALRFALNVAVCYLLAYSVAKPLVAWALSAVNLPTEWVEQLSMLVGMALYTGFNYLGQRFFAFRKKTDE